MPSARSLRVLFYSLALTGYPMTTHAIEEPDYTVVQDLGDVEVRSYSPYVVAEVQVEGPAEKAGNVAFPILAGYIFGKNKAAKKLAMTAPVKQAPSPVTLEMTAPVQQRAAAGGYTVQFVLPKGTTLSTAPVPDDERVYVREVPASQLAAIRYSGLWSQSNYQQHLERLQATLRKAGLTWTGEPVYSRYNAPFTPWFLRRNEIWLTLQ